MAAPVETGEARDAAGARERYEVLDAARGAALVAMFVFHIVWDMAFFGLVPVDWPSAPAFRAYGHAIAATFVVLAGIGLALGARHGVIWRPALKRVGRIALAALVVTVATYAIFPDEFIFFGILHLIALASLCALPLLRAPWGVLAALAVVCIVLPAVVALPVFDHPAFWWLGLGTDIPRSNDWRPFLPWFGVMLTGVLAGRAIVARGMPGRSGLWRAEGASTRALVWGGRHSLPVYLLHQPVFIAVIFVVAKMAGPRPEIAEANFQRSCETQCVRTNADAGFCKRVCGCVIDQSKRQDLWRGVNSDKLDPDQRRRFDALTRTCAQSGADRGFQ